MQVVTPDGVTMDYRYDLRSRLTRVSDQLGQYTAYRYDLHGNVLETETVNVDQSRALIETRVYDNRNRLIETRLPHDVNEDSVIGRILDENSNLVGLVDPNGATATNAYDPANRLDENTHRLNGVTDYEYDDQDRIVRTQAPNGAVTTYTYDLLGRKRTETSPDRGTLTYTYDLANNVISITDAREIEAIYGYDELERIHTKTYPNTTAGSKIEDVSYTYDNCPIGIGRLCQRADESGHYSYAYDAWGNPTEQVFTEAVDGIVYTSEYRYDEGDRLRQMILPSSRIIDYQRDGVRRIQAIDTSLSGQPGRVRSMHHFTS